MKKMQVTSLKAVSRPSGGSSQRNGPFDLHPQEVDSANNLTKCGSGF